MPTLKLYNEGRFALQHYHSYILEPFSKVKDESVLKRMQTRVHTATKNTFKGMCSNLMMYILLICVDLVLSLTTNVLPAFSVHPRDWQLPRSIPLCMYWPLPIFLYTREIKQVGINKISTQEKEVPKVTKQEDSLNYGMGKEAEGKAMGARLAATDLFTEPVQIKRIKYHSKNWSMSVNT